MRPIKEEDSPTGTLVFIEYCLVSLWCKSSSKGVSLSSIKSYHFSSKTHLETDRILCLE